MKALSHSFFNINGVHNCRKNSVTLFQIYQKGKVRYEVLVSYKSSGNKFPHWLCDLLYFFKILVTIEYRNKIKWYAF